MDFNAALSAWATFAAAVAAFCGVAVAWWPLRDLNSTLRMSSLAIVLQIETEMNSRKLKVEEIVAEIRKLAATDAKKNEKLLIVLNDQMKGCLENWLNASDRLAFCILRGYLLDKDWKTEYRGYFADLIKNHSESFTEASIYTNIIDLNRKWQRS